MEGVEEPDEDVATEDAELAQNEDAQEEEQHEDEVAEAQNAELAEEEGAEEEEELHENEVVVVASKVMNPLKDCRSRDRRIEENNGEPENEEAEEDILMRKIDQEDESNGLPESEQEGQMVLRIEQKFRSTQQALHNFEEILRQLKEEYVSPPR
uniref:Myelin transcription factor 1-like n=1 Tax=Haemonchus placei TaxID=6290 RepID=A0A0N4WKI4_HAEPC